MKTLTLVNAVFLERISLNLSIGAFSCEKTQKQPVDISVAVQVQGLKAIKEDLLEKTYNYGKILEIIKKHSPQHYELVEYLAAQLARDIFCDQKVLAVEIIIAKKGAFVTVESCGCHCIFQRSDLNDKSS